MWKLAFLGLFLWLTIRMVNLFTGPPNSIGVTEGRLAECPDKPNCVSTQARDDQHRMEPIPFDGSPLEVMGRIEELIKQMPRARIVSSTDRYLHAEFRSLVFGFVDDVEFYVDHQDGLIHFRSASRLGYSDLGANRKRMELLSNRLKAALAD